MDIINIALRTNLHLRFSRMINAIAAAHMHNIRKTPVNNGPIGNTAGHIVMAARMRASAVANRNSRLNDVLLLGIHLTVF